MKEVLQQILKDLSSLSQTLLKEKQNGAWTRVLNIKKQVMELLANQ